LIVESVLHRKLHASASLDQRSHWFAQLLRHGPVCLEGPKVRALAAAAAQDTIVLSNGENVEPEPIEQALLQSPYFRQVIIVGQDRRNLAAIVVPDLELMADVLGAERFAALSPERLTAWLLEELQKLNRRRADFRRTEQVRRASRSAARASPFGRIELRRRCFHPQPRQPSRPSNP
jgi:hypothetical protein